MTEQNLSFFQKFSQNSKNFLKIHKILPFLDKIDPYKENRVSEVDGRLLEKQWVVWYREFTPWLIDIHVNGFLLNLVVWGFGVLPFSYPFLISFGLTLWFIPELIKEFMKPLKESAKEIVRELPRK